MVKHIVMWTVKATAEYSREEDIRRMQEKLVSLPALVPGIAAFEVGLNSNESPAAFDVVLVSTFPSWQDLRNYQEHPEHLKVAEFIGQVRDQRAVVDYEI